MISKIEIVLRFNKQKIESMAGMTEDCGQKEKSDQT